LSDKTPHPPIPDAFAALGVRSSILRALAGLKFTEPSEIQKLVIPPAIQGVDILGQARTGTGKTAAFTIPILQVCQKGIPTQALILVPTRELAIQVDAEFQRLAEHTPLRALAVYGGQKIRAQLRFLEHDPEVIVGTPGRVIDLLDRRALGFDNLRMVVLDEVDRMLDIGFRDDIRNILSRAKGIRVRADDDHSGARSSEQTVQTIFVSATIGEEIEKLARKYMREPVLKLIAPGADEKPTVEKVVQPYLSVQPWDKYRLLKTLLDQERPELAIVFCRTKHGAEKLAHRLTVDGIECREIHGNLRQNKRDKVMKNFRGGKFDVLVATDLASRGIDVADISHIINYDIPDDPEVYVHRVGRTARMGAGGKAFTFVSRDEGTQLTRVESLINMLIPELTLEGFEPSLAPRGDGAPTSGRRSRRDGGLREVRRPSAPTQPSQSTPQTSQASPRPHAVEKAPGAARPLTIGSKIPRSRRRRR
jgi:ATP-dependent RNA helicase DeaD